MALKRGFVFCLVGPSGSGKTTLAGILKEKGVDKIITTTTRQPREGEVDGIDYFFVSKEQFLEDIAKNNFFEHVFVHENHYGTQKNVIEKVIQDGQMGAIILDVKGAFNLKETYLEDAVTIFLTTTQLVELESRLSNRNSGQEDKDTRLKAAKNELAFYNDHSEYFDYLMFTNHISEARAVLESVFIHEIVKRGTQLLFSEDFDEQCL